MLSIIVVVHDMLREAPRTLFTLSPQYQADVKEDDYEVVVVENGSTSPLGEDLVCGFGKNFRYLNMGGRARPSPCRAINEAAREAKGDSIGVMIDGARMASPGLVYYAIRGLSLSARAVVVTLAWHLGPKRQSLSVKEGYCQAVEDQLLDTIRWREDGYELFDISSLGGSSAAGCFGPISETSAIFMWKNSFRELRGYDEDFRLPGGGFANLDFYRRTCELPEVETIMLLGEGTFHQVHGGVATNATSQGSYLTAAAEEYARIRGHAFQQPHVRHLCLGRPAEQAIQWIR